MPEPAAIRLRRPASADFELDELAPRLRLSLRGAPEDAAGLAALWPAPLPTRIGEAAMVGDHAALCLGPDEWMLLGPDDQGVRFSALQAAVEARALPLSLVDVSERSLAVAISGPGALALLEAVIPLDIRAMAPSTATRTMLGRVEALVWRPSAAARFELEVWRSYAGYLWRLLDTATAEL